MAKCFAGTDLKYGYTWSLTASHELLEMLADPNINLTVLVQTADTAGTLDTYEVCDACEADNDGYEIGVVKVSDFVFPSWFEDFRTKGSTQFDQTNRIQSPLQLVSVGYIGAFDVTAGSGWHQVTAEKRPANLRSRGNVGSRRERRATPPLVDQPAAQGNHGSRRAISPARRAHQRKTGGGITPFREVSQQPRPRGAFLFEVKPRTGEEVLLKTDD